MKGLIKESYVKEALMFSSTNNYWYITLLPTKYNYHSKFVPQRELHTLPHKVRGSKDLFTYILYVKRYQTIDSSEYNIEK
jgi:hypothetical protein